MATIKITTTAARPNTSPIPTFLETLAIADSLSKTFVGTFPDKQRSPSTRGFIRCYSVPGLRWLWRTGDADTRATIATRLAIWRERNKEEVKALRKRIYSREILRVEGGAL